MAERSSRADDGLTPSRSSLGHVSVSGARAYAFGVRLAQAGILHQTADGQYPHHAPRVIAAVRRAIDACSAMNNLSDLEWRGGGVAAMLREAYDQLIPLIDLPADAFVSDQRMTAISVRLIEANELALAGLPEAGGGLATWFEAGWFAVPLWGKVATPNLEGVVQFEGPDVAWRDEHRLHELLEILHIDLGSLFFEPDPADEEWHKQAGDFDEDLWPWFWVEAGLEQLTTHAGDAGTAAINRRGALLRDEYFYNSYTSEGHCKKSPAHIRDAWNSLSDGERKAIDPVSWVQIGEGAPGRYIVNEAIKKVRRDSSST